MRDYIRLARKILYKSTPEQIILFVTAKCNLNCQMCFYKRPATRDENELSVEEYRRISSSMPPFYWLQISGGEPFLRDDLHEICATFAMNNRVRIINIPTNAYFAENVIRTVEKMLPSNPHTFFNIGISILGPSEIHDKITGVSGSFDKALTCYRGLEKLKDKHPNLGINFTVTQTRHNEKCLKELFDFLMNIYHPDHIAFNLARGRNIINKYSDASAEMYKNNWGYLLGVVSRRKDYYFRLPLRSLLYAINMLQKDITYRIASSDKYVIPCYAGRISAVIDEIGNLFPCEMRKKPLGNLRDSSYNFNSIWQSEEAKEERRQIRNSRCFCSHECFITTNIIFNPRIHPLIFKKWLSYSLNKGDFQIPSATRSKLK